MRISRKKKSIQPLIPHFRINDKIRAEEVRVLSDQGDNLGVFSITEALRMAEEQGIDLVEINPKADPPIVKIVDFSHFKYQKEKEARKQKANTHVTDIKGIRLSIRIGVGDLTIRQKQTEKFLKRGDKVKVEVILRGREKGNAALAFDVIRKFFALIEENTNIKFEQEPTKQGNKVTAIIINK
ncbi:MAG: translation initiation factor IF-3 [Candidatus Magasanikbacteria bacterium CG11_big_fil_rev_8_21_14_0_20_39_34]|uniref:Translation initiation factor IF-3 n=1 Tax=Candidatus Magasanikbacteria bacterium CG11_big_fil_rev_8_21_14_0_20_39_34 TaxID=1974653 RepID=A0A2H0N4K9_9BACT|nr:MAG: translation initiation factor IF-3 [Candidatus Magasanikbacteria bacterium CG11_big_fil_rev_8_21_14_0_20_39_34]